MALQEIIINAIEHGNNEQVKRKVEIEALVVPSYIKVTVKDEGEGFNWKNELNKELDYSDLSEGGRGLSIASRAVDKICYNRLGNKAIVYQKR